MIYTSEIGLQDKSLYKCVTNKIINGKQCTIVFYMDDNKINHVDANVVTSIIRTLSDYFGDLTVSRGCKYDYLGMDIELRDWKVYIGMKNQIQEDIEWGGNQKRRMPTTPATIDLFSVNEQSEKFNKSEAELYHLVVQKLMYICKHACLDIEPALSYLSTRVSNPTKDDQNKLD